MAFTQRLQDRSAPPEGSARPATRRDRSTVPVIIGHPSLYCTPPAANNHHSGAFADANQWYNRTAPLRVDPDFPWRTAVIRTVHSYLDWDLKLQTLSAPPEGSTHPTARRDRSIIPETTFDEDPIGGASRDCRGRSLLSSAGENAVGAVTEAKFFAETHDFLERRHSRRLVR